MQIVIDIDEVTYKDIKRGKIYTSVRDVPQEAVVAIANGTPLPKGHGRLIDADKLQNNISHDEREAFTKHQVWLKASIYNPDAQTIIEAESENK